MSELDEAWEVALADAERRARAAGRRDIADYVALRKQNDLLRRTAVDWLVMTITTLSGEANRKGAGIQIEQQDDYRFKVGTATMVGRQVTLRNGVRALTLEAGWPRAPHDGFVRGGGLACANLKHFGRPRANAELLLLRSSKDAPQWTILEKTGTQAPLTEAKLRSHFTMLLTES